MDVPIACPCPPAGEDARHPEGDTVVLRDRLDFRSATTIRKAIGLVNEGDGDADPAEILAVMTEWYCLLGIESWTLTDVKGKPVPVNRTTIRERLLDNEDATDQVTDVADAADTLYMKAVLLPLLVRASRSSPTGPTGPSTSAPRASTAKPRKRSRPSLTTSTQTDGIVTTSPSLDGVSNISPRSVSAA